MTSPVPSIPRGQPSSAVEGQDIDDEHPAAGLFIERDKDERR